jgi:hypothetical protein
MLVHFSDAFWIRVAICCAEQVEISAVLSPAFRRFAESAHFQRTEIFNAPAFDLIEEISRINLENDYQLSRIEIEEFFACEVIYLMITDRLCIMPISVQKRKTAYYELLRFWLNYFHTHKIEAIFFQSTPHLGADYIIYSIAKKLGIRSYIFSRTLIENRIMVFQNHQLSMKVPEEFACELSKEQLTEQIGLDLSALIHKQSYWIKRSHSINSAVVTSRQRERKLKLSLSGIFRQLKRKIRGLQRRTTAPPKVKSVFFLVEQRPSSSRAIKKLERRMNLQLKKLRSTYESLCVEPNIEQRCAFFAMHFQPERTTLPEGGVYEDQILAIDTLSKAVPADFIIYVKEHPRQFEEDDLRKVNYRDESYYMRILRNKNVRLVSIKTNQPSMIDLSSFVSTINGSVGWEAILRGKGCVLFSNCWYSAANCCYVVDSLASCQQAIHQVIRKDIESVMRDLLRFVLYTRDRFIISATSHLNAKNSSVNYETCVANLSATIIDLSQNGSALRRA